MSLVQARLTFASGILAVIGMIIGATLKFSEKFAALDTRLGKLESAIKAINAEGPDEKYRQLVKELMAQRDAVGPDAPKKAGAQGVHTFGGNSFPADAGAAADAPAVKVPQ